MKKTKKKRIVIAIILVIILMLIIKFFNDSKADNLVEISANMLDSAGLLSDEKCTILATNEGENGYAITLPDIVNNKRVSKYFVENKKIEDNTNETENLQIIEKLVGEKIYLTRRRSRK